MKHNWEYKRLGDVCKIVNGFAFKSELFKDSGMPILRIANIQNDTITTDALVFCNPSDYKTDLSKFLVKSDDLVMALSGATTGKIGINKTNIEFYLNQRVALFKDILISRRYLFYFLKTEGKNILESAFGVAQPNVSTSKLTELYIPVPTQNVQEQIVAELDKINETIEDCRELLRNLDALKLSLFYDYFGDPNTNPKNWNISTFGEIGTFIRGGGFLKRDFVDFGIPCIHYGQIHTKFGEVVRKNLTYISEYTALKSKFAKPNDVILAITSEDLEGSCKSVAWLGDFEVAVGGHAAIFTHNQNPVFISFYTRSNAFCIEKEKYAHGSKVVEIRPKDIEKIPIYLPPLELQEKFADRIEQIEAQKKTVENTIAELQTLLDSRMDYWFN